jgi:retinol-binding protein 3
MRIHVRRVRSAAATLLVGLGTVASGWSASAQTAPAATLTADDRRAVIDSISAEFVRYYVDADTGRLIADRLQARRRAGTYDSLQSPSRFAQAVTEDLRAVNGDRHLVLFYDPSNPDTRPQPRRLPTPGAVPDTEPLPPALVTAWRRTHFGLGRVDVLPGNVGYLEVRGFMDGPEARALVSAALAYLETTDAIIFDLREMPGGSGDMSNFIISHFSGPDSVESLRITNRSAGESVSRWTLAKVPGRRRPEVPLYVLTSRGTASAGEDFAFVLHNLKRATLVGDRTAGAGHNNATLAVGHGFIVSISYTRVADPRTGKEWERVGVQPDTVVNPARALDVAHALALRAVAARTADPAERNVLALQAEYVSARTEGRAGQPSRLRAFTGRYGTQRIIRLEGTKLIYLRGPGLPPLELVAIRDSVFAATPENRLKFERFANGELQLQVIGSDGTVNTYPRTGPAPSR